MSGASGFLGRNIIKKAFIDIFLFYQYTQMLIGPFLIYLLKFLLLLYQKALNLEDFQNLVKQTQ